MKDATVLSHWYCLMEDFTTSSLGFYDSVEAAIKERSLPDLKVSRVTYKEGGVATAKREYLRVERGNLTFDICAAPYGKGHFFSWWLARVPLPMGALILGGVVILGFVVWGVLI